MIKSNSGCFGALNTDPNPVDDTLEAEAMVDDIVQGAPEGTVADTSQASVFMFNLVMKRLKMLTWAVAIIAIYLTLKELK